MASSFTRGNRVDTQATADGFAKASSCRRVIFETGRMSPILRHGLRWPVVCVESWQAHQALKSLATHKTDCNAGGLAHLARTGSQACVCEVAAG
jgi:hypothetical protein